MYTFYFSFQSTLNSYNARESHRSVQCISFYDQLFLQGNMTERKKTHFCDQVHNEMKENQTGHYERLDLFLCSW